MQIIHQINNYKKLKRKGISIKRDTCELYHPLICTDLT